MDAVIYITTLLLVLLSIGKSSQKYCDVIQSSQGGRMQCYGVNIEDINLDLTSTNYAFTEFTISFGEVSEMPFDVTWHNQKHLQMLEIKHSGLKTIRDNAWLKYPSIEKIDFSHNQIKKINNTDFEDLDQLKELYLNNNNIYEIEQNAFDGLRNLQKLNLSSNLLTTLNIQLQSTLQWFSISNNPLEVITQEVFRNANNLQDLEIDNINPVTVLKLLQMLPPTLTSLSMMKTRIPNLNATTFSYYDNLKRLFISNDSIEQIDDGTLAKLPNLAVIFASRNNLEAFPKTLRSLQSLVYLDLSYNRISEFDDDLMAGFVQLTNLDVSNNPLVYDKSDPIKKMDFLQHLKLDRVGLNQESGLIGLLHENLLDISLANNNITAVPSTMFTYSVHLKTIDLSHNLIGRIEEGSFSRNLHLTELHLEGNKLTEISPKLFLRTSSLKTLDLSDNNIQEVPTGIFYHLTNLTSLNLSYNHDIDQLDGETFSTTTKLEELYLQGNKINSIPSQLFLNTSVLKHLDMSDNSLEEISIGTFDNLHNLVYLNLSINKLKMLDDLHLYALRNLQQLYLHGNHLRSVSGLESLININDVSLENNDWQCDSLLKAIKILRDRFIVLKHDVVRNASMHLKGIPCSRVLKEEVSNNGTHHELSSGDHFGYIIITLLSIILFLICCICVVKIYKKISKSRQVNMYRSTQYSNDYKDVVRVEDENKTNSTIVDEKNSLYNCYEVVE